MNDPTLRPAPYGADIDQWGAWMAAAQDGDRSAYQRLLTSIVPALRAMASRSFRDPADVDDVVQDILIALHEARASYDPARPFRPWMAGIARHRIIDRLRQQGRRNLRETALTLEHETFAALETNEQGMGIDSHTLNAAIDRLPDGQRLAVRELKLKEGSLQSVARDTGMTEGALKVAAHRAIRRLRQLLGGGEGR